MIVLDRSGWRLAAAAAVLLTLSGVGCGGSGGGEEPAAWRTLASLPVDRINAVAAAPGNGHVYLFDGYLNAATCNVGTCDGRLFSAPVGADGAPGAWTEGTALPAGARRSLGGVATANGFIYLAGGAVNAPAWDGAVWFARAASDGSLGAWTEATNPVPTWLGSTATLAASGGHLYAGGGIRPPASPQLSQALYVAPLDASTGQPGAWTEVTSLPGGVVNSQLVVSGGKAYFLPGGSDQVFVAAVQGDHTLGAWTAASARLPAAAGVPFMATAGGKLVVVKGGSTDLYQSTLGGDGTPGAWSNLPAAPVALSPYNQAVVVGGRILVLGNSDCGAAGTAAVSAVYLSPAL